MRCGLVVPTYNAGGLWPAWLTALSAQRFRPDRVLVIDSSSRDRTADLARAQGHEVLVIPQSEFNHGATRQRAADQLGDCELLIYLTQDALLADAESLARLAAVFADPAVGLAYGCQLPHAAAGLLEAHARLFNYPDRSYVVDLDQARRMGIKGPFLSNSFSAYRRAALQAAGGFPRHVIVSEDMYVGARALLAGWKLAYCAEARVRHSHAYSLRQELGRYFDIGVFNARESWIRETFGGAGGEGRRFVLSESRWLLRRAPWRLPEAWLRTALKFLGYSLGLREARLPVWLKRGIGLQKYFWTAERSGA